MIIQNQYSLDYKENGSKSQKIYCPKPECQNRRNKKDKSLSVNIESRVFKCHHCGWSGRLDGWKQDDNFKMPDRTGWSNFSTEIQLYMKGRGIGIETIKANKIIQKSFYDKEEQGNVLFLGFPYLMPGQKDPVNVKWRRVDQKQFRQEAEALHILYNVAFWANESELIICEGEMDVLSFNEAGIWNATTLSDGAINEKDKSVDGKLKSLYNSFQWIENKQKIYLCLDNDAPGRRLKDELIKKLGPEKCLTVTIPNEFKDVNELLQKQGVGPFRSLLENAKPVPVSGIFYVADQLETMLDTFQNGIKMGERTHMGEFDRIFRWKKGQVNLWTGYANMGKTTFFLQAAMVKSILDEWKWAVFSPENYPATDFYDDLIEMYVGKNVSDTYGNKMSLQEYMTACDFLNNHFIFIYPEEDHTIESLHEKFAYLIMKHGIDGVLIDPYNQLEKSQDGLRSDEEISDFMRKVKRFTVKHEVTYNIIAHPKITSKLSAGKEGEFEPADAYDVAGGAMWANKSDNIISYHRPNWFKENGKKDPTVHVYAQKIKRKRTGGDLDKIELYWDFKSSRFFAEEYGETKFYCDPGRKQNYLDSKSIKEEEDYF